MDFDRLIIKIFTVFLFTVAFFLGLIVTIHNLDSRNLTHLSTKEKETGLTMATSIEKELTKVPKNSFRWWMHFIVVIDNLHQPGQFLYVLTTSDQIITAETDNIDIVRNFNELNNKSEYPIKKIYDKLQITGPFTINYSNEIYHLYIMQAASSTQSQFVNLVFDHPFLLLTFTMLASTPFLLWLAWSLTKPARRLKQAIDQVARGNLQECPELETFGSSEFKATGANFNHMLRELKHMQDLQQRLLSNISHELKALLTRLQLAASLSRRKYGETKENERIEIEGKKLDLMLSAIII